MSEWNEKKLEEELNSLVDEVSEQEDMEKKILQGINRRICRSVIGTLCCVAGVILTMLLVISPLMNHIFLNPYALNQEPEQEMLGVLRDYYETTGPYREVISLDVEKKGFACYELELQVADLTEPLAIGAINVWCDMVCGTYRNIKDPDGAMTQLIGRFECDWEDQEVLRERIRELPESAKLFLSVSDTVPKTLDELRKLPVKLEWIQVYQPNVEFQGGFSMQPRAAYAEDDRRENRTGQELLEIYQTNLENLLEHEEIWERFGLSDGSSVIYAQEKNVLTKTYEDAKKLTELKSENYCVYGKRDEVIRFLEETELDSILVDHVLLW